MVRKSGLKCLKLSIILTFMNLLLSFTLVWYTRPFMEKSSIYLPDNRLLLSLEGAANFSNTTDIEDAIDDSAVTKQEREEDDNNSVDLNHSANSIGPTFNPNFGVFDKFRRFQSHMFNVVGESWSTLSSSRALCLGAQTSVDRLYELVELVKNWSGPMSIAVFVPDIELAVGLMYIQYLRSCNTAIERQVSFHLIYPVEHQGTANHPDLHSLDKVVGNMDCKQPKQVLKYLLNVRSKEMLTWRESYSYPQNLLRNLAKNGCQTNYTYIPDIDMVPTSGMDLQLETFLAKQEMYNCTKCAYVIPTYEVSTKSSHLPTNKTELLQFVKNKQARQFHQALFSINQKSSNLKKWEKIPQSEEMDIAYKVEKYIFKYEPLYIARGDSPAFDERFIGFGMTRNTQVYEMFVTGYSFFLLNNAFTNHWGFQSLSSRPGWRARQQEQNNARFDEFAKEVFARYGVDPFNMMRRLKKMNLKHIKVDYGVNRKNNSKAKKVVINGNEIV